ncbi:P22 phage major capsid protein family protein [Gammaproteobacteria bacterium]|nr:P22 phage major capsid protein family protein [Gammaproteobacteria bacterium]
MAYSTSSGSFSFAAGENHFIPEVFSKKLQAKFYAQTMLSEVTTNEYEGEISGLGNKVNIRTVPAVTVADYSGSISYSDVTSSTIELDINKAKSYAFKVDDILREQADIDFMNEAANDAAQNMKIAIEQDVFANVAAGSSLTDINGTPANITSSTVLGHILDAGQLLDENNIPEQDRFMIINPEIATVLKQSELRQAYLTGDNVSPLRNGFIGQVDRFNMYVSNNLSTTSGVTSGLYGHPKAIAYASQMTNTETVRLESSFGDGVRGLAVYGYKVVLPTAIGEFKLQTA